ncbi:hypothetical protein ACNKHX_21675 [Shigella flexneri]
MVSFEDNKISAELVRVACLPRTMGRSPVLNAKF